jgi:hypothetical protein
VLSFVWSEVGVGGGGREDTGVGQARDREARGEGKTCGPSGVETSA